MKVAMIAVSGRGYSTRAMKPMYMAERYARIFERSKKYRRMTDEEVKELKAPAPVPIKEVIAQPVMNSVVIDSVEPSISKEVTEEIAEEVTEEINEDITEAIESGDAPRTRRPVGRPRKPKTSEE